VYYAKNRELKYKKNVQNVTVVKSGIKKHLCGKSAEVEGKIV